MKQASIYHKIRLKKLELKDINRCITLDLKTFKGIWTKEQWEKELKSSSSICIGINKQSDLIGLATGYLVESELNINLIAINHLYQRQGLGKLLIESLLSRSKKLGAKVARLEVKEGNLDAQAFYESINFMKYGFREKLYKDGSNAILYKLLI